MSSSTAFSVVLVDVMSGCVRGSEDQNHAKIGATTSNADAIHQFTNEQKVYTNFLFFYTG